jgi:hypothetical protein
VPDDPSWDVPSSRLPEEVIQMICDAGRNGAVFIAPLSASGNWFEFLGSAGNDGIMPAAELTQEELRELREDLRPYVGRSVTEVAEQRGIREAGTSAKPSMQEQIDRAIAQLCPCGAEPSEDFYPYCGDDCRPSIRGRHTDLRPPGTPGATPVRWRPDLVSEIDDTGMTEARRVAPSPQPSPALLAAMNEIREAIGNTALPIGNLDDPADGDRWPEIVEMFAGWVVDDPATEVLARLGGGIEIQFRHRGELRPIVLRPIVD